ncbi:MAG: sugar transferase, partial [Magnetospirillum sp.]|nr:sugar transferase [Magnetospirillum sp.]
MSGLSHGDDDCNPDRPAVPRGGAVARRFAVALLFAVDATILQICVLIGLWLRGTASTWMPINLTPSTFHGIHLAVLALPLGCSFWSLYPGYGLSPVERLRRRTLVALVGFGLMSVYDHMAQSGQWSRGVLLITMVLAISTLPLSHMMGRRLLSRLGLWGERVVVLGERERCKALTGILSSQPALGWIPAAEGEWPPTANSSWHGIDMAILVPPPGDLSLSAVTDCLTFRRFVIIPDLAGRSLGVSAQETGIGLGLGMRNNLLYPGNRALKRCLDLLMVLVVAPLALPLILGFTLGVKIVSPGPAFYSQLREGLGGRPFRLWKIRSMSPDAEARLSDVVGQDGLAQEEWKSRMKLASDPRVIPGVGRFMRRFSIDELPQLLNVLLGHMSLVGPRPLPAYHLAEIPPALVELRRQVRPGITGWAQISGRSESTVLQQVEHD